MSPNLGEVLEYYVYVRKPVGQPRALCGVTQPQKMVFFMLALSQLCYISAPQTDLPELPPPPGFSVMRDSNPHKRFDFPKIEEFKDACGVFLNVESFQTDTVFLPIFLQLSQPHQTEQQFEQLTYVRSHRSAPLSSLEADLIAFPASTQVVTASTFNLCGSFLVGPYCPLVVDELCSDLSKKKKEEGNEKGEKEKEEKEKGEEEKEKGEEEKEKEKGEKGKEKGEKEKEKEKREKGKEKGEKEKGEEEKEKGEEEKEKGEKEKEKGEKEKEKGEEEKEKGEKGKEKGGKRKRKEQITTVF
ncbi:hypothetical protein STEG23_003495 [Scotinomys teguina]